MDGQSRFYPRRGPCSWVVVPQIEDVEGNDEVTLTRKFGNEKWVYALSLTESRADARGRGALSIRVMFSIADIQNAEEESEFEQENEGGEDDHAQSYPVRVSFSVTKVGRCVVLGSSL